MITEQMQLMMEEKVQSLDNRNRIVMSYLCLARDRRFFRIPEEGRIKLIQSVLEFGDELAEKIRTEFGTSDPRRIVEAMGLKVVGADKGKRGTLLRRSEYRPGTKEIIIYRDALNELMREVSAVDLSDRLLKMLIAHELFHHLEHSRLGSVPKRFRVALWKLGPLTRYLKMRRVSEVAAHAFAETLLDIKQSPMVFDCLTYLFYSGRKK